MTKADTENRLRDMINHFLSNHIIVVHCDLVMTSRSSMRCYVELSAGLQGDDGVECVHYDHHFTSKWTPVLPPSEIEKLAQDMIVGLINHAESMFKNWGAENITPLRESKENLKLRGYLNGGGE